MAQQMLNTDRQFDQTLAKLAEETGQSPSDVIRNAIATYKYLKSTADGEKISITKDGEILKNIVLP